MSVSRGSVQRRGINYLYLFTHLSYNESMIKFDTSEDRSQLMKKIKSSSTQAETLLAKALWHKGFRYQRNCNKILGKPDIVFISKKIAIFIDGEFWHGYNWNEKKVRIKDNRDYWITKIEKNILRDRYVNAQLCLSGWIVLRFWEKEVKSNLNSCIEMIVKELEKR